MECNYLPCPQFKHIYHPFPTSSFGRKGYYAIELLHRSYNAPFRYPTFYPLVTEMCTWVQISIIKWCIAGYLLMHCGIVEMGLFCLLSDTMVFIVGGACCLAPVFRATVLAPCQRSGVSVTYLKIGYQQIESMDVRSSNELQWLTIEIGHQKLSSSNGRRSEMPY